MLLSITSTNIVALKWAGIASNQMVKLNAALASQLALAEAKQFDRMVKGRKVAYQVDLDKALDLGIKGLVNQLCNKHGWETVARSLNRWKIEVIPASQEEFEAHHLTGHIRYIPLPNYWCGCEGGISQCSDIHCNGEPIE